MQRIISLFLAVSLLTCSVSTVKAQNGAGALTANNLSPQVSAIIESVKNECNLNPNQTIKFTNDYVSFLNQNAKNTTVNAGNSQKMNSETQRLLVLAGMKFRGYLNDGQFSKLSKMIQGGKLNPDANAAPQPAANNQAPPQPSQQLSGNNQKPAPQLAGNNQTPASKPSLQTTAKPLVPASVSVQSNVTSIFEQLSPYMKVTPDQSAKAIPILKQYDQSSTYIKTTYAGNNGKIQSELATLNTQTIAKLKPILSDEQIGKIIIANTMQENILSGKNLSQDQKIFLDKLRNQYSLNDVQLMAVILMMVEGKVRGDAINQMAKTNPQGAAQELGKLLQDLDGRLKSALSAEQYAKVKADIEKLIKGQKI